MKIINFICLFLMFSTCFVFSQEKTKLNDTISLITRSYSDGITKMSIHKFANNNYIKTDTLHMKKSVLLASSIYRDKYILDYNGQVYNIKKNEYLFKFDDKSEDKFSPIGIYDNKIYFYKDSCYWIWYKTKKTHKIDTCNCYYYFNFNTEAFNKINSISKHPYLLNKKGYNNVFKFYIVYYNGVVFYLGDKFKAEAFNLDDNKPPFLWLSEDTFLTQTSNGIIVKSDTIGNIDTIVAFPRIQKKLGMAKIYRDSNNTIVYEFFKSKPVFEYKFHSRYSIDIENKTVEKYNPTFYEGDFKYTIKKKKYFYYDNDKFLFKKEYFIYSDNKVKINKNYLAYVEGYGEKSIIKIYNSHTKKWISIKNSNGASIIGWVKE